MVICLDLLDNTKSLYICTVHVQYYTCTVLYSRYEKIIVSFGFNYRVFLILYSSHCFHILFLLSLSLKVQHSVVTRPHCPPPPRENRFLSKQFGIVAATRLEAVNTGSYVTAGDLKSCYFVPDWQHDGTSGQSSPSHFPAYSGFHFSRHGCGWGQR
jgi:hypothetical protein